LPRPSGPHPRRRERSPTHRELKAAQTPAARQPLEVVPSEQLDVHAEAPSFPHLPPLAVLESRAHDGALDVRAEVGEAEVWRERFEHRAVTRALENECVRFVLPVDPVLVEDPRQLPLDRVCEADSDLSPHRRFMPEEQER